MLDLLKDLLEIEWTDTSKDTVLDHYLSMAKDSIQSHLNYRDDEMGDKFQTQIVNLAMFYFKNKDIAGTVQRSEGSTSITIERGIPKQVLSALPLPRVRIVGGR